MMLTVKEVAQQLSVSATCVYQLVASGQLPSHRFGLGRGTVRVSEGDLASYVERNRHASQATEQPPTTTNRKQFRHLRLNGG